MQHTANHGGLCLDAKWNQVWGWFGCDVLLGKSSLEWRYHHMVSHHSYCNDHQMAGRGGGTHTHTHTHTHTSPHIPTHPHNNPAHGYMKPTAAAAAAAAAAFFTRHSTPFGFRFHSPPTVG